MTVDKVIAKIIRLTFFGPPCIYFRKSLRAESIKRTHAICVKL